MSLWDRIERWHYRRKLHALAFIGLVTKDIGGTKWFETFRVNLLDVPEPGLLQIKVSANMTVNTYELNTPEV